MKAMNTINTCLSVLILLTLSGCPDGGHGDDRLETVNNSLDSIFSIVQFSYPDTTLLDNGGCIGCFAEIAPNTTYKHLNSINWESDIKRRNEFNTVTVFIIHSDTLRKYSFEQLQLDYNILRRYDLTIDQLKIQNWKITYP